MTKEGIQLAGAEYDLRPVLWRGSNGEAVGDLQTMLRKLMFHLAIDQDFGAATEELALMRFQGDNKLAVDGIVGQGTWDAIEKSRRNDYGLHAKAATTDSRAGALRPSEFLVLDALR